MVVEVRAKREDGTWEAKSFVEADARFPVSALGVELGFAEVYEGVPGLEAKNTDEVDPHYR